MRWPFRRIRMVERTCLSCGETWQLKASLARYKSRRGFSGIDVGATRQNPMSRGALEMAMAEAHRRDAQADKEIELFRRLQACPKCGSSRYTEMRIKGRS